MRSFYEEWAQYVNRQPSADDLKFAESELLLQIRQPMAGEMDWNDFVRKQHLSCYWVRSRKVKGNWHHSKQRLVGDVTDNVIDNDGSEINNVTVK